MGLIEQNVMQLEELQKKLDNKTITDEQFANSVKIIELKLRHASKMINTITKHAGMKCFSRKETRQKINALAEQGWYSSGDVLVGRDMTAISEEMIMCPDQEKPITRSGCLDYSGSAEHYDTCRTCRYFAKNRDLLLENQ